MKISPQDVLNALKAVEDPDLHRDIVSLGFVKDLEVGDNRVSFTIQLTTPVRSGPAFRKTSIGHTGQRKRISA